MASRCPICRQVRPPEGDHRPFCSPRCREIDLARWLDGAYAIPTDERPDGDEPDQRPGKIA